MAILLGIVAPVFALILMGAAGVRLKFLDAGGQRGLNDFVYWLALPALLFGSVVDATSLRVVDVAGVYFLGCLIVFAIGAVLARLVAGAGLANAAMVGLNSCYGNTVMLGIPIVAAGFGPNGVALLLGIIALHSALLLPLASVLIEADRPGQGGVLRVLGRILPALLKNPIVMSVVLAFLWRLTGWKLPDALHRLLHMLGAGGPALALFCLGMSLAGLAGFVGLREALVSTALKLVALPVVVGAIAHLAGLSGLPFAIVVLTAGMPTGANAFLLARQTDTFADGSAGTVVIGTAASLATLSVLLVWLR